jgi:hypothetical protein
MKQGSEKFVSIGRWGIAGTSCTDFVIFIKFSIAALKKRPIPQC